MEGWRIRHQETQPGDSDMEPRLTAKTTVILFGAVGQRLVTAAVLVEFVVMPHVDKGTTQSAAVSSPEELSDITMPVNWSMSESM